MATLLQKMLQPTILLDIATRSNGISVLKGDSDWDDIVAEHYSRWMDCARVQEEKFKNEIQWARHELAQHQYIDGQGMREWHVTAGGQLRLQQLALRSLGELNAGELAHVAVTQCTECASYLQVLKRLPQVELFAVVQSSFSESELFLNGLRRMPVDIIAPLFTELYEVLRDVFFQTRELLADVAVQ